jgi:hypothetical protein
MELLSIVVYGGVIRRRLFDGFGAQMHPMRCRKVVEGEQGGLVFGQALGRFPALGLVALHKRREGGVRLLTRGCELSRTIEQSWPPGLGRAAKAGWLDAGGGRGLAGNPENQRPIRLHDELPASV